MRATTHVNCDLINCNEYSIRNKRREKRHQSLRTEGSINYRNIQKQFTSLQHTGSYLIQNSLRNTS